MRMSVLTLALAVVMVASAHAEEREYRDQISGTAAPSAFDSNGDGVPAHYVTFSGWSTFGPVHGAFLVEYDFPTAGPNSACPAPNIKIPIIVSSSTRSVTLGDAQLYLRDDSASALFCLNPATGAFTMALKGTFVGGAGRLSGASGAYEYRGTGNVLLQDKKGLPFGGFSVRTTGKVILP